MKSTLTCLMVTRDISGYFSHFPKTQNIWISSIFHLHGFLFQSCIYLSFSGYWLFFPLERTSTNVHIICSRKTGNEAGAWGVTLTIQDCWHLTLLHAVTASDCVSLAEHSQLVHCLVKMWMTQNMHLSSFCEKKKYSHCSFTQWGVSYLPLYEVLCLVILLPRSYTSNRSTMQ